MGYFVTRISLKKAAKTGLKGSKRKRGFALGGASGKVMCTFTRQLSILQDAGLPVLRSLKILESQAKGGAATAAARMQQENPSAPPPNFTPACNGPISYRDHEAYKQDIANFNAALQGLKVEEAFICSITPGNVAQVLANQYYPSREDYLRARLKRASDGTMTAAAFARQDSSMQATLYVAQGLIVRAPFAPAAAPGDIVDLMEIDF